MKNHLEFVINDFKMRFLAYPFYFNFKKVRVQAKRSTIDNIFMLNHVTQTAKEKDL